VGDDALLAEVFEGRFSHLFAKHGLATIGDLKACRELSYSEIYNLDAWLKRCWWFW
jgi:hypothetical protein